MKKRSMVEISVVIPLWNKEEYVERSLRSVFAQTLQPKEIIVVDDGCTDGSVAVVQRLGNPLVRIVKQKNAGVSAARNRGAEEARSEFVAFLDADDIWLPNHLEETAALIENYPDCGVFATLYRVHKVNGYVYEPRFKRPFPFDGKQGVLSNFFEIANDDFSPIHVDTLTVRKQVLKCIGGFPVGMPSAEDIFTIARLYTVSDIAYSRKVTVEVVSTPHTQEKPQNATKSLFPQKVRRAA